MGKLFKSSQLELGRNRQRESLEIFGQTSLLPQHARAPGSQTNVPLFSKVPGSAWDDALRTAERLLEGKDLPSGRPSSASRSDTRPGNGPALPAIGDAPSRGAEDRSLDHLIGHLEAAEKDPSTAASEWAGLVQDTAQLKDRGPALEQQQQQQQQQQQKQLYQQLNYQQKYQHQQQYRRDSRPESSDSRRSRKSSESETARSAVSEDYMSERAAQWGYGVVLKGSSRDSTPRTSGGSMNGAGGSSSGVAVPAVSRDVKDALSSFMLAFLVCDCTQPDFPILYASAGFTTMTGYSTDEIVGKNCRFLQGPDTDREEIAKVREALKTGSLYSGTLLNYKKDGTPFWNLLTLSPIKDDDGKVIKYIGMQAEQHSKEAQPRNSKGQKSPAIRSIAKDKAPSRPAQNGEKEKLTPDGAPSASPAAAPVGTSHRPHSSSSIPRPPVVPNRPSPATGLPERRTSGPELYPGEDQSRRMSNRYSLTSNPVRSTRNSSVDEFQNPHYRRASKLQEIVLDNGFKASSSSGEAPDTPRDTRSVADSPRSAASSDVSKVSPRSIEKSKSKTNKITARILRLFRKDSKESKRNLEAIVRGKEVVDLSGSDDDDENDNLARNSGSRRHSSVGGMRTSSQMRLEASADALTVKLARMQLNAAAQHTMSSSSPRSSSGYDGSGRSSFFESSGKQQFGVVEPSSSSSSSSFGRPPQPFDGNKQQFNYVEPTTPPRRASGGPFDRTNKQQFCYVEPTSAPRRASASPFDGTDKQQFCIVEPSSPVPRSSGGPFDGTNKQQFCIVEPSSSPSPPAPPRPPSRPPGGPFDGTNKQQFCIVHT